MVVALAVLAFLGWITWAGLHGAWTSTEKSAQILGYAIGGFFGVLLAVWLWRLPLFLSPRYVILDAVGLSIRHGKEQITVPWQELVAVGIGYEIAPEERAKLTDYLSPDAAKDRLKTVLTEQAEEALQVSGKRKLSLEIYPAYPEAVDRYPRLKPYWKPSQPPRQGLPPWQWHFPLPPVMSIARAIGMGAYTVRPERWLGWYPRG